MQALNRVRSRNYPEPVGYTGHKAKKTLCEIASLESLARVGVMDRTGVFRRGMAATSNGVVILIGGYTDDNKPGNHNKS